jgi:Glycosyl hydrolases family 38 C-terminal beta sandwich domain/Glycosyl hydrolases family 38 C-terminal domain/Glycosyl hydrolases family 38 N-terminal domain
VKLRIFVAFKTHFDIGFTGLVNEVLDGYANVMVPQALDACRQTMGNDPGHRYVWTLPAWPLAYCLRRLSGTEQGEELARKVREGVVCWHALAFTTHTELFGLEDLIRGMYIGRSLAEMFGRRAVAAKMTDVPGHTWILPTLLAAAGVRFLHLGCNPCSTPPEVPRLFLWEGPDGSQVRTMYSRGGYGTGLLPPPDWKLPVWLALQHTVDNAGPQRAEIVEQILRSVRESSPGTDVVFGTLDDFARALDELSPELPVVRKDFADSWIHGAGSMPRDVAELRGLRNRLVQVESALALRSMALAHENQPEIDAIYEKILLFGEHTWGMDTKLALNPDEFGGRVYDKEGFKAVRASGRYDRIQRSWADKENLVTEARDLVQKLEVNLTGRQQKGPLPVPAGYEVVNHHLWEWTGPLRLGRFKVPVTVLREPDGSTLPVNVIDGDTWVTAAEVAPLSSVRLRVEKAGTAAGAPSHGSRRAARIRASGRRLSLENGLVRVQVDAAGSGIVGLIDLGSGRNWVDRKAGGSFGAYRYDVYSRREIVEYLKSYAYDLEPWYLADFGKPGYPEMPHQSFKGSLADVVQEEGEGWARLRLLWKQDLASVRSFGNVRQVTQDIMVFDGEPWVDVDYSLDAKEACPLLEAGHVVFPFLAQKPRYAVNKTGSVIDPARDIERNANRLLYCCERWVDVSDGNEGVLVIPRDAPLFSIGSPGIERFDGEALPGKPVLFFNLFNTQWGTNFPQWIEGSFKFGFRLVPHAGDWRKARAWELSAAALQPPSILPASPGETRNTAAAGLLAGPVRSLETVTLKTAEDGSGMILRLREPSGRAGRRTLRFRLPAGTAAMKVIRCSLLEDEQEELPVTAGRESASVTFSVHAFEVLTLKLKR